MKLKYRLRRIFFAHKHEPTIREIAELLAKLKIIRIEIQKYDRLMQHGILGDRLWDKYVSYKMTLDHYLFELEKKKEQYKQIKIR